MKWLCGGVILNKVVREILPLIKIKRSEGVAVEISGRRSFKAEGRPVCLEPSELGEEDNVGEIGFCKPQLKLYCSTGGL